MQKSVLIKAGVALAVLWCVVLAVAKIAGDKRVTPESFRDYVAENALEAVPEGTEPDDADARKAVIREIADRYNRLNFEQRRELRQLADDDGESDREFFERMTKDERRYFIELTVDAQFKSAMEAFNEMGKEERGKMIKKIREDMASDEQGVRELEELEKEDEEILNKVVDSGMRAYYQDADADVKLELAPLMEEIHTRMQRLRHR